VKNEPIKYFRIHLCFHIIVLSVDYHKSTFLLSAWIRFHQKIFVAFACQEDSIDNEKMINGEGINDMYEVATLKKCVEAESENANGHPVKNKQQTQ